MNTKLHKPKSITPSLLLGLILSISGISIGCEIQPNSLFEQQAEAESANKIKILSNTKTQVAVIAPVMPNTANNNAVPHLNVIKNQVIAQQPNCDAAQRDCQYLELNILHFNPEQPWLTSIMWQTIARVLAPTTPLASEDETAKKTVSMLFNQIAYAEQAVPTLPMYQRIDTELVFNPTISKLQKNNDTSTSKNAVGAADSGYLVIRSNQHRSDSRQQQVSYVMLDIQKKLKLTINDILLPQVSTDELLLTVQTAKREWLTLQDNERQSAEQKDIHSTSLALSQQWYLDNKGLHMVYQAGELSNRQIETTDLIVPYTALQGLIKPQYLVF
ncbi:hypothetical protein [Psychrobacter urativorans]|uniref:DUF3298 domain-containing protein n=1 Tax=Psychrobacter urativorans TaxID=45610 RepID=A0A0M4TFQ5_9GAMM|nr:hypothetical protein [Psychrobacter urativorans]ALF60154.1 hypothetical protein AOC03_08975 [Psychrobacter urativorans]